MFPSSTTENAGASQPRGCGDPDAGGRSRSSKRPLHNCAATFLQQPTSGSQPGLDDPATGDQSQRRSREGLDDGEEPRITHVVTHFYSPPPFLSRSTPARTAPRRRRSRICSWIRCIRGESDDAVDPKRLIFGLSSPSAPCGSSCEELLSRRCTCLATRICSVRNLL